MIKALRHEMFRTTTVREAPLRVDRNNNVIRGVKLIQLGAVNDDRLFEVVEDTLADVLKLGARKSGLKSRFTHPSLSDDGLGSYLGRLRNLQREDDAVIADLHIADVAFDSPRGDIGTYVMDLAEEDAEAFGMSLATVLESSMYESEEEEDENRILPLRFRQIYAGDVVDSPAATRGGLFNEQLDERSLPAYATWVMDHYFCDSNPKDVMERFQGFLSKYYSRKQSFLGGLEMSDTVDVVQDEEVDVVSVVEETEATEAPVLTTDTVQEQTSETDEAVGETQEPVLLAGSQEFVEQFGEKGAMWFLEGKTLNECYALQVANLREQIEQLGTDNTDLQAKLDAALLASGEANPLSAEPDYSTDKKAKRDQKIVEAKKRGTSEAASKWASIYEKQ